MSLDGILVWVKRTLPTWLFHIFTALYEVLFVTICGLLPFLFAVLRFNYSSEKTFEISAVFKEAFSGGQIYLYAFSMLGSLVWISLLDWRKPYRGMRSAIGGIVVLIGLTVTALGGIDPSFSKIGNPLIIDLSYYCYGLFIFLWFLLLLLDKEPPPSFNSTMRSEANDLAQRARNLEGTT
jgi:hypothetical protein